MKSAHCSEPILIPEDIAARCDRPDQFDRFDKLFRGVISVPKSEVEKAEAKWQRTRKRQSKRTV
jgi:hypothetical protein